MRQHTGTELLTVGWREWVSLPELGLKWIKAKIDSGHQASFLHVFFIELFEQNNTKMVRFGIHPAQHSNLRAQICELPLSDIQQHLDNEQTPTYSIVTILNIGGQQWPVKLKLSQRDDLDFRLQLGHSALDGHLIIDPAASFTLGCPPEADNL